MVNHAEENIQVQAQETAQEKNIQKLIDERTKDINVSWGFGFMRQKSLQSYKS